MVDTNGEIPLQARTRTWVKLSEDTDEIQSHNRPGCMVNTYAKERGILEVTHLGGSALSSSLRVFGSHNDVRYGTKGKILSESRQK